MNSLPADRRKSRGNRSAVRPASGRGAQTGAAACTVPVASPK